MAAHNDAPIHDQLADLAMRNAELRGRIENDFIQLLGVLIGIERQTDRCLETVNRALGLQRAERYERETPAYLDRLCEVVGPGMATFLRSQLEAGWGVA
jgi:hypothetical protein